MNPEDPVPRSGATKFHSRTYLQVSNLEKYLCLYVLNYDNIDIQTWLGGNQYGEADWVWMLSDRIHFPVTTDLQAASKDLLEIIKLGCSGSCDTRR